MNLSVLYLIYSTRVIVLNGVFNNYYQLKMSFISSVYTYKSYLPITFPSNGKTKAGCHYDRDGTLTAYHVANSWTVTGNWLQWPQYQSLKKDYALSKYHDFLSVIFLSREDNLCFLQLQTKSRATSQTFSFTLVPIIDSCIT